MTAPRTPSRSWASTTSPARDRANGDTDPISQIPLALGAKWGGVRPFVLRSASQFRIPPPPALTSARVHAGLQRGEAPGRRRHHDADRAHGGPDHRRHLLGLRRNAEPEHAAAAVQPDRRRSPTSEARHGDAVNLARLFALVHTSMADAGIACWESKYVYKFWRPIGGIREGDTDGNPDTHRRSRLARRWARRPATSTPA